MGNALRYRNWFVVSSGSMAQLFKPSSNTYAKLSIFGALFAVAGLLMGLNEFNRSSYMTNESVAREQPVPFSHKHHVGELGIDCRYCHTAVETSSFAGIPATQICMNCHSQIWKDAPMLEPVRASYRTGQSLEWTRVNDVPDFVYFDHSIHIAKGVGCASCHGDVAAMNLTWQAAPMTMEWCLSCHRDPGRNLRPREKVFDTSWVLRGHQPHGGLEGAPGAVDGEGHGEAHAVLDQETLGRQLIAEYQVRPRTDCSTCHR